MDTNASPGLPARAGTAGGTLLGILLQINGAELLKTVLLTAIGAAVSFLVSHALQQAVKKKGK